MKFPIDFLGVCFYLGRKGLYGIYSNFSGHFGPCFLLRIEAHRPSKALSSTALALAIGSLAIWDTIWARACG